CNLDRRIEPQHIPLLRGWPDRKAGDDGRATPCRQTRKCEICAGNTSEKWHKCAIFDRGVLVDQNSHRFISAQGLQDRSREIALRKQRVTGKRPSPFDDLIDEWIIKRPDHHAHGRGEQTVRISAQLPVAQVRSGEKNSFSLRNGSLEVLESLVADPVANLSFSDLWK